MYFSSVERRWSACLTRSVSEGVSARASENATGFVNVAKNVEVRVSESVMMRLLLRESAPPSRARASVSRQNQRGNSMLEDEHVGVARNGLTSSSQ